MEKNALKFDSFLVRRYYFGDEMHNKHKSVNDRWLGERGVGAHFLLSKKYNLQSELMECAHTQHHLRYINQIYSSKNIAEIVGGRSWGTDISLGPKSQQNSS